MLFNPKTNLLGVNICSLTVKAFAIHLISGSFILHKRVGDIGAELIYWRKQ